MIAIDIPMPNNCCDCPVNDHDAWCGITLTEFADDFVRFACRIVRSSTSPMTASELFGISEQLKDS